jgi:hypothetical protein
MPYSYLMPDFETWLEFRVYALLSNSHPKPEDRSQNQLRGQAADQYSATIDQGVVAVTPLCQSTANMPGLPLGELANLGLTYDIQGDFATFAQLHIHLSYIFFNLLTGALMISIHCAWIPASQVSNEWRRNIRPRLLQQRRVCKPTQCVAEFPVNTGIIDNHLLPVHVRCVLSEPLFPRADAAQCPWLRSGCVYLTVSPFAIEHACHPDLWLHLFAWRWGDAPMHLLFHVHDTHCYPKWTFLLESRWTKVKGLYVVTRYVPFLFFIGHLCSACTPSTSLLW